MVSATALATAAILALAGRNATRTIESPGERISTEGTGVFQRGGHDQCNHFDQPIEVDPFPPNGRFDTVDDLDWFLPYIRPLPGSILCDSKNPSTQIFQETCGIFFTSDKPSGKAVFGKGVEIFNWYPTQETPILNVQFNPVYGNLSNSMVVAFMITSSEPIIVDTFSFSDLKLCKSGIDSLWTTLSIDMTNSIQALNALGLRNKFESIIIAFPDDGAYGGFDNIEVTGPPSGNGVTVKKVEMEPLEEWFNLPTWLFFAIPGPFLLIFSLVCVGYFIWKPNYLPLNQMRAIHAVVYVWQALAVALVAYSAYELVTLNTTLEELRSKETARSVNQVIENLKYHELIVGANKPRIGGGADVLLPFMPKTVWIENFRIVPDSCDNLQSNGLDASKCLRTVDELNFNSLQLLTTIVQVDQNTLQNLLFASLSVDVLSVIITLMMINFENRFSQSLGRKIDIGTVVISSLFVLVIAYFAFVRPLNFEVIGTLTARTYENGQLSSKLATVRILNPERATLDQETGNFILDLMPNKSFEYCFPSVAYQQNMVFLMQLLSYLNPYCLFEGQATIEAQCINYSCLPNRPSVISYQVDYQTRQELVQDTIINGVVYVDILLTAVDILLLVVVHIVLRRTSSEQVSVNPLVVEKL